MTWRGVLTAFVLLLAAAGCGNSSGSDAGSDGNGRVSLAHVCPDVKKAIDESNKIPSPRQDDEIAEYTQLEQTLSDIAARLSVADASAITNLQEAASGRLDVFNYEDSSAADSVKSIQAFAKAQTAVVKACRDADAPID